VGRVVYVRFHGTSGHYAGSYGAAALNRWAHRLADDWQAGRDVFAYFNNDPDATATRNARSLHGRIEALAGRVATQARVGTTLPNMGNTPRTRIP
jgi:uncharacterized protein YecE (DUF72 family)